MATDEIRKEADKIVSDSAFHDDYIVEDLVSRGIKRGIYIEQKRLRKQVGTDADEWSNIKINNIDIWDD